jgi:hypothetical protein
MSWSQDHSSIAQQQQLLDSRSSSHPFHRLIISTSLLCGTFWFLAAFIIRGVRGRRSYRACVTGSTRSCFLMFRQISIMHSLFLLMRKESAGLRYRQICRRNNQRAYVHRDDFVRNGHYFYSLRLSSSGPDHF